MNKEFKYYNYTFNIKVEKAGLIEVATTLTPKKRIIFNIIINDMGYTSYYKSIESTEEDLEVKINQQIELARKYVDDQKIKKLENYEIILNKLGFK